MRPSTKSAIGIAACACVIGGGLLIWQNGFDTILCIASLAHGEPGAFVEVRQISAKLNQVNATNELQGWLEKEIISAQQMPSNLLTQVPLKIFPSWVTNIYGYTPAPGGAQLILDREKGNDHVELLWANGRGMLGTHIGGKSYDPHLNTNDVYVIRSCPGVYVWCPRKWK